jgi:hypothetical protein
MKTKIYSFCFLSALVVALLVAGYYFEKQPLPSSTPVAASEGEPVAASQPENNSPASESNHDSRTFATYQWQPGEQACWKFDLTLRLSKEPEKIAEAGALMLGGKLQMVILSTDSNRVTAAASLANPYYVSEGARVPLVEGLLRSTPAVLTLTPAGNLVSVEFPRNIPEEDRNILRMAYGWEFVVRNAPAYQEDERIPTGASVPFRAAYRRPDANHIYKRRFAANASTNSEAASQKLVTSEFSGSVGRLWVQEMTGWEDAMIYVDGSPFAMSRIAISFKPETNAPALPPILTELVSNTSSRSAFSSTADPAVKLTESVAQASHHEALVNRWSNVPFDEVQQSVQMVADGTMQEIAKPLQDLKDWLEVHPQDGPASVLQSLQTIETNNWNMSGLLVHGLAQADTATARQALMSVLQKSDSYLPTVAIQAAAAVGDLGAKADANVKQTLAQLMDSRISDDSYQLSETALFAYARLAKDDTASQGVLVQKISPWLEKDSSPEDTVKAISALANAAVNQPEVIARVNSLANSGDESVREAAKEYLESLTNANAPEPERKGA